jgi:hypothetical protein
MDSVTAAAGNITSALASVSGHDIIDVTAFTGGFDGAGTCSDGSEGDPCGAETDCQAELVCVGGAAGATVASAKDALKITGGTVEHNDAFTVLVPTAAGGLGVTATVMARTFMSSTPSANQIHWHLTGDDPVKIANLKRAINGTSDTSKVKYGSGITNGTTVGIKGLTASDGIAFVSSYASLTADNAGPDGNNIAIADAVGTVLVNESALTDGKLAGGSDGPGTCSDGSVGAACEDAAQCQDGLSCLTGVCTLQECGSLQFDASKQGRVRIPAPIAFLNVPSKPIHMQAWVYPEGSVEYHGIGQIRKGPGCQACSFMFGIRNNTLTLDVEQGYVVSEVSVETNQWTFVFASWNPANNQYRVGKVSNGSVVSENLSLPGPLVVLGGADTYLTIGHQGTEFFNGHISELSVWTEIPGDSEIITSSQGMAEIQPVVEAYYRMNEDSGDQLTDHANDHDGEVFQLSEGGVVWSSCSPFCTGNVCGTTN